LSGRGLPGGGCVVTIGSYDGIHLGHRALLARLAEHAARRAEPSVLLTFEPLPREYLVPDDPPARLTSLRERWRILLSDASLGYLWLLRFGEPLRNLPAEAFAQLLAEKLRARVVVVGHDFRFARRGEATARGGRSSANSARSCALRRALRDSRRSPRRCGATPTTRAASSRPDVSDPGRAPR